MLSESPARSTLPRLFLAVFGVFLILSVAWTFATPLGAVPDEPAHMVRAAAAARGEAVGTRPPTGEFGYPIIDVPEWVAQSFHLPCEVGDASHTAKCVPSVGDDTSPSTSSSSSASNSPVFYTVVGLPSLFIIGDAGLYAMRLVSAIITSLLLAAMILALRAQSKTLWPVAAGFVAATPMMFFLGGSVNANGVEAAGAGALAAVALLIVRTRMTTSQLWRWGSVLALTVIATTSGRTVALLWVAIVFALVLIVARPAKLLELIRRPPVWAALAVILIALIWVVVWFKFISITAVDPRGYDANRVPGLKLLLSIMSEYTFNWWDPWIGQFGWLDVNVPIGVRIAWEGAIAALLLGATILSHGRMRVAMIFISLVVIAVPIGIQGSLWLEVGWIWQGRYMLPVYSILLVVAGAALDAHTRIGTSGAIQARFVRATMVVLAVGHLYTFVYVLRRFVVATQNWLSMITHPQWQPPLGWAGISVVLAVGLALEVVLVYRLTRIDPELRVDNSKANISGSEDPNNAPLEKELVAQ